MKNHDARSTADLSELMNYLKDIKMFKDQNIVGKDLLEVCEMLTYEKRYTDENVVDFGKCYDQMWIVLDGKIEFKINIQENPMTTAEVQNIAEDMGLPHDKVIMDMQKKMTACGLTPEAKIFRQLKEFMNSNASGDLMKSIKERLSFPHSETLMQK